METTYAFAGVYPYPAILAQRVAVLYPVVGSLSRVPADILTDVEGLQQRWRKRARSLASEALDNPLLPDQAQRLCNCPPAIAQCPSATTQWFCKQYWLCPFCYARNVGELYRRVYYTMAARYGKNVPSARRGVSVWYLRLTRPQLISANNDGALLLPQALRDHQLRAQASMAAFKTKCGVKGGMYRVRLDVVRSNGHWQYRVSSSGLMIVSRGKKMKPSLMTGWSRGMVFKKSKRTRFPSRNSLAVAVGKVCRYPAGLLDCPADLIAVVHASQQNLRTMSFVGSLYGYPVGAKKEAPNRHSKKCSRKVKNGRP